MGKPPKIKYGRIIELAFNDARKEIGACSECAVTPKQFRQKEFPVSLRAIEIILEKLEQDLMLAPKQRKIDMQGHNIEIVI